MSISLELIFERHVDDLGCIDSLSHVKEGDVIDDRKLTDVNRCFHDSILWSIGLTFNDETDLRIQFRKKTLTVSYFDFIGFMSDETRRARAREITMLVMLIFKCPRVFYSRHGASTSMEDFTTHTEWTLGELLEKYMTLELPFWSTPFIEEVEDLGGFKMINSFTSVERTWEGGDKGRGVLRNNVIVDTYEDIMGKPLPEWPYGNKLSEQ